MTGTKSYATYGAKSMDSSQSARTVIGQKVKKKTRNENNTNMINLPPPPNYRPSRNSKGVFRKPTKDERALIADFIRKNSCYAAELEFGISSTMTRAIAKQFGIAPKPIGRSRQYTSEDVAKWVNFLKTNPRISHAAVAFGCSESTIKRLVNEFTAN